MTDIVSVPSGNFTPGAYAALQYPAALINAAWNQANQKFDLFEAKMGLATNISGTGWLGRLSGANDRRGFDQRWQSRRRQRRRGFDQRWQSPRTIAVDLINVGKRRRRSPWIRSTLAISGADDARFANAAPTIAVDSINVGNPAAPTIAGFD